MFWGGIYSHENNFVSALECSPDDISVMYSQSCRNSKEGFALEKVSSFGLVPGKSFLFTFQHFCFSHSVGLLLSALPSYCQHHFIHLSRQRPLVSCIIVPGFHCQSSPQNPYISLTFDKESQHLGALFFSSPNTALQLLFQSNPPGSHGLI